MALPNDPSGIPARPNSSPPAVPDEIFGHGGFSPGKSSLSRGSPAPIQQDEDVFQTGDSLPEPTPRDRESAREDRKEMDSSEQGEDGEPGPEDDKLPDGKSALAAPGGKMGLIAALVAILALVGGYAAALHASRPNTTESSADVVPNVPMNGEIATVTKVESGWRARRPSDRVSTIDTILPDISRAEPTLLPEVKFSIDPVKSKEGYLRFIFLDPDGQISGDVLVVKVSHGKLESESGSAEVISPTEAAVYCSFGFLDTPSFIAYATNDGPRWHVEISESSDYNSGESGWKRLGFFEVSSRR